MENAQRLASGRSDGLRQPDGLLFEVMKVEDYPDGTRRCYLRAHGEWVPSYPSIDAETRQPDMGVVAASVVEGEGP